MTLEQDQQKVKADVEMLTGKISSLMTEKAKIEARLDELRLENLKLEAFLVQARENPLQDV